MLRGVYRCREIRSRREQDRYGRDWTVVRFEIDTGPQRGRKFDEWIPITVAKKLGLGRQSGREYEVWIHVQRHEDGREANRISRICPVEDSAGNRPAALSLQQAVEGDSGDEAAGESAGWPTAGDFTAFTTGFEVLGDVGRKRQPNEWRTMFAAACTGENLWPPRCPVFLSAFVFTDEFRTYLANMDGSAAGFSGAAYCPLIWFDIDREVQNPDGESVPDINSALEDTRGLVGKLLELGVPESCLLVFFSGNRGFHIGVFTGLFAARPSVSFAKVAGLACGAIARSVGCEIDESIYKTVQPLRAPNSPHEKSGLFKVLISLDELRGLASADVLGIATQPRWFEPGAFDTPPLPRLATIWRAAEAAYAEQRAARVVTAGITGKDNAELFRATMEFLAVGSPDGERATEGFKAGMNLLDFGDIESLVAALLAHGFERSGYPPSEAQQQIEGVLRYWHEQRGGVGS